MLGAARAYAEANQATLLTPFILAGAMAPGRPRPASAPRRSPRRSAGMTFVQLVRPGAPVVLGSFASSMSMQSGAPTFGTPEPALVLYVMAALARRLGVPFRSGGSCAPRRSPTRRPPTSPPPRSSRPSSRASTSSSTPRAGWRAACGRLREVHPRRRPVRHDGRLRQGRGHVRERPGARRDPGQRPGHSTSSAPPTPWPTSRAPSTAREIADNNSFEQWQEDGSLDAAQRANAIWKRMLAEYEAPPHRPRRRRGAARLHRPAQGVDAGLGGLDRALPSPPTRTDARPAAGARRRPRGRRPSSSCRSRTRIDQAALLPAGATVSVTASPAKGIEATRRAVRAAPGRGFRAVPHLSARMIRDRAHLADLIAWLEGAGVDRAFVVGGDAKEPGDTPTACRCSGRWPRSATRWRDRHPVPTRRVTRSSPTAAARGAPRQGAVRQLHDDPAVLRPGRDRRLGRGAPSRGLRRCRSTSASRASPTHRSCWRSPPGSGSPTRTGSCQEPALRARLVRSGGFYRRRAARGSRRRSPTRPPASSTSTCTRSTPSSATEALAARLPRLGSGGRPTASGTTGGERLPGDTGA